MIVLWHFRDLRVEDHPALNFIAKTNQAILPIYIHDPKDTTKWAVGSASCWWLHHALDDLQKSYQEQGSKLHIFKGSPKEIFSHLMKTQDLQQVCMLERFEPDQRVLVDSIQKLLSKHSVDFKTFEGTHLIHPDQVRNQSGKPYSVFTPFSKSIDPGSIQPPLKAPKLKACKSISCNSLEDLQLLPKISWDKGFKASWNPTRKGALDTVKTLLSDKINVYKTKRDFLAEDFTSTLSPYLAFGQISPKEVWHMCQGNKYAGPFLRQLLWREFGNYFIYHSPHTPTESWREEFENFPWSPNEKALKLWQKGLTGYPIVDAGMRQLWQTGWMHNRARMIVASFLVKDLLVHWIEGAKWFWDTLVDADLANNTLGWQWTAGCGPDAAPYFRIFNPILQGKRFDPEGLYVKKYVPELAKLDAKWIHAPWEAPIEALTKASIQIGENYPKPIVDHAKARDLALAQYEKIKKNKS